MAKNRSSLLGAGGTDWDKAWDIVSRLGAARKHLEHGTGTIAVEGASTSDQANVARPLHRALAVWILIGALWISIGMIVSAAIVTVAFLA